MEWYAIYEIRADGPKLLQRFDTKAEALAWAKNKKKPGEYALFTRDETGWSFVPVCV